jgi:phosphomannomutase
MKFDPHVFRTNSIRGIFGKDFDAELFERIGASFAVFSKAPKIVVASDHRVSSPTLKDALSAGLIRGGADVVDAGVVPKGTAIYAARSLVAPLAYVSASHLPREWNGLKFIHPSGCTFNKEECDSLYAAINRAEVPASVAKKAGVITRKDFKAEYLDAVLAMLDRPPSPLKILVDHGNGTSAVVVDDLLARLGFKVTSIYGELDGTMPNRTSDVTPETLRKACAQMAGHDLGVAFDGDADRIVFIDGEGAVIDPERFAYVLLRKLTRTQPGPVVANVACGGTIAELAVRFGRRLYRTPVGVPNLIREVVDKKACFGMEVSSHLVIPSVAPYDDACAVAAYAAVALSEAVAEGRSLKSLLEEVPLRQRKRITLDVPDAIKTEVVRQLDMEIMKWGHPMDRMDGLRVNIEGGSVLIRPSNTEPSIRIVVECADGKNVVELEKRFVSLVNAAVLRLSRR